MIEKSQINKTVLENGLTIITERMDHVRSVSLGIWIKAGSNADPVDKSGLAHFTEHMLFKGTIKRSLYDIVSSIENLGGSIDAFTTRDVTCLNVTILAEHLDNGFDILSDMIKNSVFPEVEIKKEKAVVIEEIKSSDDIPEEFIQDYFADRILNPHPESKSVLGKEECVLNIFKSDIVSFIDNFYIPQNMIISLAGNIRHKSVVNLARKYFNDISNVTTFNYTRIDTIPFKSEIILKRDINQTHVCIGYEAFGYSDYGRMPLMMINTILSGGMSGLLFQKVREKHGLVYTIYSYMEIFKERGYFATYTASDAKNILSVTKIIKNEFNKLKNKNISKTTLENIKSQLKGNKILSMESTFNRMEYLAKNEIYLKNVFNVDDVINEIESVSVKHIRDTANKLFNDNKLFTVILTK